VEKRRTWHGRGLVVAEGCLRRRNGQEKKTIGTNFHDQASNVQGKTGTSDEGQRRRS